jgi:hypothetical protein
MGSKNGRTAVSFVWAAVPFVSFGFATAPAFLYPAIRCRKPPDLTGPLDEYAIFL